MNAQASSAAVGFSPRDLQTQIREALPSIEKASRVGPLLPVYQSVDDVIADLKPAEPVFCIEPAKLREAAASFQSFPGRALYAVKCNPHPYVLETLFRCRHHRFRRRFA